MPSLVFRRDLAVPVTLEIMAPPQDDERGLKELSRKLALALGQREHLDPVDLEGWINAGYQDICSMVYTTDFESVIEFPLQSGKQLYLLPSNVQTSVSGSVTVDDGSIPLSKTSMSHWRSLWEGRGTPSRYFKYGDYIVVWPTPEYAMTMSLTIRSRPALLKRQDDAPMPDPMWDRAILLSARAMAHSDLKEFDVAREVRNEKIAYIRERRDLEALEREGMEGAIQPLRRESDVYGYHDTLRPAKISDGPSWR